MAMEAFLINPARLRKVRGRIRRKRRGGLPSRLLSRMMKTYGPRKGMREAWSAFRRGITRNEPEYNPWFGAPAGHARAARKGWKIRHRLGRYNPFGEEVMIVGANPKRRRRRVRFFDDNPRKKRVRRRRARARRVGLFGRLRRRLRINENPRRIRRRRVSRRRALMLRDNPRRYRVRRYRSNPRARRARAAAVPALSIARPMSILMPVAVGTAAYLATEKVPAMVKMTTDLPRLGVKAAVGVGGGMLIGKFLGKQNGAVWLIGSGINLLNDILNTYVFKTAGVAAGFGAFPYSRFAEAGEEGVGAYPGDFSTEYPSGTSYPM